MFEGFPCYIFLRILSDAFICYQKLTSFNWFMMKVKNFKLLLIKGIQFYVDFFTLKYVIFIHLRSLSSIQH